MLKALQALRTLELLGKATEVLVSAPGVNELPGEQREGWVVDVTMNGERATTCFGATLAEALATAAQWIALQDVEGRIDLVDPEDAAFVGHLLRTET